LPLRTLRREQGALYKRAALKAPIPVKSVNVDIQAVQEVAAQPPCFLRSLTAPAPTRPAFVDRVETKVNFPLPRIREFAVFASHGHRLGSAE
jgi:hypothetical protein